MDPKDVPALRVRYDEVLDRLAVVVASEEFARAFVWWAVLLTIASACAVCAIGFHASGAVHLGAISGVVGGLLALAAVLRIASITDTLRGSASA